MVTQHLLISISLTNPGKASQIEHKCVLDSCRYLKDKEGFDVTFIKPEVNGLVNLEELAAEIRPDTSIVSIMAVNNEIGPC